MINIYIFLSAKRNPEVVILELVWLSEHLSHNSSILSTWICLSQIRLLEFQPSCNNSSQQEGRRDKDHVSFHKYTLPRRCTHYIYVSPIVQLFTYDWPPLAKGRLTNIKKISGFRIKEERENKLWAFISVGFSVLRCEITGF